MGYKRACAQALQVPSKIGGAMKEFFVGLIFLIVVLLLAGVGFILFPFVIVMGLLLRFVLILVFFILVIWLLGKTILLLWEKMK